ncbi:MAG: thioredoxin family protein [bacterium]
MSGSTAIAYLDETEAPTPEQVGAMTGPVLLEFGTEWCGFCRAAASQVAALLAKYPDVRHVKVSDGPGQRLGRFFKVRLWPNLVFLRDGKPVRQLARPGRAELDEAFRALATASK